MNVETAKESFLNILHSLEKESDRQEFYNWLQEQICEDPDEYKTFLPLKEIADYIKTLLPLDATFASEQISNQNSMNDAPVIHVDGFLFDDDEIEILIDEGKLSRYYCKDCRSQRISPLTFISHSMSIERIIFLFKYMLPNLTDKCFLDIGSRLGSVLYGAYHFSKASKIIGVEMNEDMCNLQKDVIKKYNMEDRIEIICDEICNLPDIVKRSDVIILNNVFEYFMNKEQQTKVWLWLRDHITKPGTMMITIPSMEDTLKNLGTNIIINQWLERKPISSILAQLKMKNDNMIEDIYLYVVK